MSRVVSATSARRNDEKIVNAADALDAAANKGKVRSVLFCAAVTTAVMRFGRLLDELGRCKWQSAHDGGRGLDWSNGCEFGWLKAPGRSWKSSPRVLTANATDECRPTLLRKTVVFTKAT